MIRGGIKSELMAEACARCRDRPLAFAGWLWPKVVFYREQRDIIESVLLNDETYVVAGNKLGKDFVAAFVVLWYFLVHRPVRILTTSVDDTHLDVLWGEMDRFVRTARYPLLRRDGGPLVYLDKEIRRVWGGIEEKDSYVKGRVSKKGEGMAGHHAPWSLLVVDEASGVEEIAYEMGQGWAKRMLIFGNPNECAPTHFFRRGVKAGDLLAS